VNVFLWAGTALILLQLPLVLYVIVAPSRLDLLPTLQTSGALFALALVCLSQGFHRTAYTILSVVAAVLTFAGTMVFVRFFERELDP
jgi:multisubunit Na+/H+ antiporter MnhF subunit